MFIKARLCCFAIVPCLACLAGETFAYAAGSPLGPWRWRMPPSHSYAVQLPAAWRLHIAHGGKRQVDSWIDPLAKSDRLVVTLSSCAHCVSTGDGHPNARAALPAGTVVTSTSPGRIAFTGRVLGVPWTEHGLVIVTRNDHRTITGSIVLQVWMPDVLFPGSENKAWSHLLNSFAAEGRYNY